jgi:hypothetical protein
MRVVLFDCRSGDEKSSIKRARRAAHRLLAIRAVRRGGGEEILTLRDESATFINGLRKRFSK